MRVLFFASDNSRTSGAFHCLVNMASLLQSQYNVDCCVVLPYEGDGVKLLDENGVRHIMIKSGNWVVKRKQTPMEWMRSAARMAYRIAINQVAIIKCQKMIDEYKPDFIHINTLYSYVGAIAGKRKKVPVVWHIREILEEGFDNRIWNRRYGYRLIGKSKKMVCVSNSVKEKYSEIFSEQQLRTIYDGVNEQDYPFSAVEEKNEVMTFICVGALVKAKGQAGVIKACAELKKKIGPGFKLQLVGRGPDEMEYRDLVNQLDLNDVVEFCGPRDDVPYLYRKAHFSIINSVREAFGRVTIEAMLCGSYMIWCKTGATVEIMENGKYGLMFKQDDVEDLCNKMLYAIRHVDELMEKRYAIREYALNRFTSGINAKAVYDLYQQLATGRSGE